MILPVSICFGRSLAKNDLVRNRKSADQEIPQ